MLLTSPFFCVYRLQTFILWNFFAFFFLFSILSSPVSPFQLFSNDCFCFGKVFSNFHLFNRLVTSSWSSKYMFLITFDYYYRYDFSNHFKWHTNYNLQLYIESNLKFDYIVNCKDCILVNGDIQKIFLVILSSNMHMNIWWSFGDSIYFIRSFVA